MNVAYKCRCMAAEVTIAVADRRDDQDVLDWVERTVGEALGQDHRKRSPQCQAATMEYAKFEMSEGQPIGRVSRQ